jgi:hypothetical protein
VGGTVRAAATVARVATTERCDSCGGESSDTVALHRVYVTPAAWDTEEKVQVLDEVERWCSACRTHYPHQELAGGDAGAEPSG